MKFPETLRGRSLAVALLTLVCPVFGANSPAVTPGPLYLLPTEADMLHLLAPPPAADSPAQRDDLRGVLEAQRAAKANHLVDHAIGDADLNCDRVADVLGNVSAIEHDTHALEFLTEAAREAVALTNAPKFYWKRTRPYAFSNEVEALGEIANAKAAPAMVGNSTDYAHVSYPSGHSTFGTVCAILLADMIPEKRAALFARGLDYAHSRLVLGAHFPTDIEGGRLAGTVAAELLQQNPRFQQDFAVQRISLRSAMKLPAEPTEAGSASGH